MRNYRTIIQRNNLLPWNGNSSNQENNSGGNIIIVDTLQLLSGSVSTTKNNWFIKTITKVEI